MNNETNSSITLIDVIIKTQLEQLESIESLRVFINIMLNIRHDLNMEALDSYYIAIELNKQFPQFQIADIEYLIERIRNEKLAEHYNIRNL